MSFNTIPVIKFSQKNLVFTVNGFKPMKIHTTFFICVKQPFKNRHNKGGNDKWQLNEGRKYCRMLPLEHSAILLTCIK